MTPDTPIWDLLESKVIEYGGTSEEARSVVTGIFLAMQHPEWVQALVREIREELPESYRVHMVGADAMVVTMPIEASSPAMAGGDA